MATNATITIRTDKKVKDQAQKLLADLGMDQSTAMNVFLRQTIIYQGLPFAIRKEEPNKETWEAIEETYERPDELEGPYTTKEELLEALHA